MAYFLLLLAIALATPLLVVGTQCLVALLAKPTNRPLDATLAPATYKILMPAHNEGKIIGDTLSKLIPQLPDSNPGNIVVIADNCDDDTARLAKEFGTTVLERQNDQKKGKGFALDYGIQQIRRSGDLPDVLVILDADCDTTKAALLDLIETVKVTGLPAQMVYLMRQPGTATIKQKIAGFAWLLKNRIRLLAMDRLGLPVILTGTGMAFPWPVWDKVQLGSANLVEDMQLGIDCAIQGYPPVLCANAYIYSDFPEHAAAEQSQRTRWEHGHLETILHQVPKLAVAALRQINPHLLALALDIGVPPLSLLVLLSGVAIAVFIPLTWFFSAPGALLWLAGSFAYFAVALAAVWRRFGQDLLTPKDLSGIPWYIWQKISIYAAFISNRQRDWVRTERDD